MLIVLYAIRGIDFWRTMLKLLRQISSSDVRGPSVAFAICANMAIATGAVVLPLFWGVIMFCNITWSSHVYLAPICNPSGDNRAFRYMFCRFVGKPIEISKLLEWKSAIGKVGFQTTPKLLLNLAPALSTFGGRNKRKTRNRPISFSKRWNSAVKIFLSTTV